MAVGLPKAARGITGFSWRACFGKHAISSGGAFEKGKTARMGARNKRKEKKEE